MTTEAERAQLLEAMASLGPDDPSTFLMPRRAKRLLDPMAVVVIGARGSGKSALAQFLVRSYPTSSAGAAFRMLLDAGGPPSLYVDAFSQQQTKHPDPVVLDDFVRNADDETLRGFWLFWLGMSLVGFAQDLGPVPPWDVAKVAVRHTQALQDPMNASRLSAEERADLVSNLDKAEQNLAEDGVTLTAVYDDLDLVGAFDPTLRARFVRALLAMWSSFSTRYKAIRAKIFIPPDLLDLRRFDTVDVSKLMARAERLEWDTTSLYHLVLRHLAQRGPEVRAWLERFGVAFHDLGDGLGWMPTEPSEDAQRRWLTATLRKIVAVNGTRNWVEQWIPNRLRDSQDRVAPRSMLGFFREAARLAEGRPFAPKEHLLAVEDAAGAIGTVGTQRVAEIRAVYEWVDRLEALRGKVMPKPRPEIEALVDADPPDVPKPTQPRDGPTVTRELVRMGLLRELGVDDLLDLPDLFVEHFGVRRTEG
jgi:hypothetical protein